MQLLPLALLTGVSGLVSAVILTLAFQQYLVRTNEGFRDHVQQRASEPLPIRGSAFTAARAANWSRDGSTLSIIEALDGEAVFKTERRLNAEKYAFLRLKIEGLNPSQRLFLFWHTAEQPEGTFYYQLDFGRSHTIHTNLLREDFWKGNVTELVIGVFGDPRGRPITLHEVTLLPMTPWALLSTMVSEWRAFKVWDQTSINVYRGAPARALAYPAASLALWVAGTTLLFSVLALTMRATFNAKTGPPSTRDAAILAIAAGWALLHAVWLDKLLLQNGETRHDFLGKTLHEKHLADWDGEYYRVATRAKALLGPRDRELAILYSDTSMREPFALRLRYHLLPDVKALPVAKLGRKTLRATMRSHTHALLLHRQGEDIQTTLRDFGIQKNRAIVSRAVALSDYATLLTFSGPEPEPSRRAPPHIAAQPLPSQQDHEKDIAEQ
jgi:hypothetical protein